MRLDIYKMDDRMIMAGTLASVERVSDKLCRAVVKGQTYDGNENVDTEREVLFVNHEKAKLADWIEKIHPDASIMLDVFNIPDSDGNDAYFVNRFVIGSGVITIPAIEEKEKKERNFVMGMVVNPKATTTSDGAKVVRFSIPTHPAKDETLWNNITIFDNNNLATNAEKILTNKKHVVLVCGERTKFNDNDSYVAYSFQV